MPDIDSCTPDLTCDLLVGFAAAYDKASNRLYERHLHSECRSHLYDHDSLDRLTRYRRGKLESATGPVIRGLTLPRAKSDFTYNLDLVGNWLSTDTVNAGQTNTLTETRHYDGIHGPQNQISKIDDGPAFAYDGNGNLTFDGTLRYQYDALNRLKSVSTADDQPLVTYWYDALGRRVKRDVVDHGSGKGGVHGNVDAGVTVFLYAGEQCVEERDAVGQVLRQYVWGQYVDELVEQREATGERLYPVSDLTWRTVALTDKCGRVVEAYDTDAYGRTLVFTNAGPDGKWFSDDDVQRDAGNGDGPFPPRCRYLFTGREFDAETGLYSYRARHYHPELGRFLQRDPLGYDAGDENLYAYCGSNPVVRTDPDGRELFTILSVGAVLLGAALGARQAIDSAAKHGIAPSGSHWALGAAGGAVFGLLAPGSAWGSAIGGVGLEAVGWLSGAENPSGWFQAGALIGGTLGGGAQIGWGAKHLGWGTAIGLGLVAAAPEGIGMGVGFALTKNIEGAEWGMMAGGSLAGLMGRGFRTFNWAQIEHVERLAERGALSLARTTFVSWNLKGFRWIKTAFHSDKIIRIRKDLPGEVFTKIHERTHEVLVHIFPNWRYYAHQGWPGSGIAHYLWEQIPYLAQGNPLKVVAHLWRHPVHGKEFLAEAFAAASIIWMVRQLRRRD